jgi:manganese/zinc/iron transport system substrate-binding protein
MKSTEPMGRSLSRVWPKMWGARGVILGFLVVGVLTPLGCNSERRAPSARGSGDKYRIVTTVGMVTDIVRQVAGDKAEVVGLLGEGVDPHLYRPTSSDVKQLAGADIVFYSGLFLEGRMQESFEQLEGQGRAVHAVTDALDHNVLMSPPAFEGHHDPHVWMDVSLWGQCVGHVARVLSEFDADNAEYYQANARRYHGELNELGEYVHAVIDSIPQPQRVLVTAHDAFEYFSKAYNIPVRSAQGISTASEPGVNDINELVAYLVDNKIRAIFVETSVSQANLLAVIEGAESKGWEIQIGGLLFSDAMGAPGTYEGTYIGMLDHNATVIARALGGEAPPKGMQGKLQPVATEQNP